MKTHRLLLACLLVGAYVALSAPAAQAQVRPEGNINFLVGFPQGEFSEKLDDPGVGISFFGGLAFDPAPVLLGAELGLMIYGQERRSEPFSTTIPDVRVDVETSNNIAMGHLLLRLQPPNGTVRPYVDGLFGFKYLFTETRIENQRFGNNGDPIAVSTNFDDVALSYGAGGGLQIQVYSGPLGKSQRPAAIKVNLGTRYLFGGEAEYLQKGSIRRGPNGTVEYDVSRSKTDLLLLQIGATLRF